MLTGAGTSAFAGAAAGPGAGRPLRRRVDAVATTDIVGQPARGASSRTCRRCWSRSPAPGDSPESVAATAPRRPAADARSATWSSCCNGDGELARAHADGDRLARAARCRPRPTTRGFAMTSSFTSMVLAVLARARPGPSSAGGASTGSRAAADRAAGRRAGEVAALADRRYRRVVYLGSGRADRAGAGGGAQAAGADRRRASSATTTARSGFRHGPKAMLDRRHARASCFGPPTPTPARYDDDIAAELRRDLDRGEWSC